MKHKHTPCPWTAYKRMPGKCTIEISRLGLRTVIAKIDDDELCPEHHGHYEANAEFIVRAVNSHEELVKALNLAEATIQRLATKHRVLMSVQGTLRVTSAALSRAEGGST